MSWLYRVGVALTLDERRAKRLVAMALDAYPEPGKASESRLIAAMREAADERAGEEMGGDAGGVGGDVVGLLGESSGVRAMAGLSASERRVVLLCVGAGVPKEIVARAFGASGEEFEERLIGAERKWAELLGPRGDAEAAGRALRSAFGGLELGPADATLAPMVARVRRRRRRTIALGLLAVATFVGLMIFVMSDLLGWDERQDELRQFSNPIPEELAPQNIAPAGRR